ncbi:MAG TPA: hypothetical protein VK988_18970 [Acidimicrobiales bacterium]|nr:hypothetical protein [Acidimicrobiales bacterium]
MAKPNRLPTRGPGRVAALAALEAVVAADTVQTLDEMTRSGWPVEAALESYRSWWATLINAAIDEGVAEWIWRVPS